MLTLQAPTTALRALAVQLSVLAVIELNLNTLLADERTCPADAQQALGMWPHVTGFCGDMPGSALPGGRECRAHGALGFSGSSGRVSVHGRSARAAVPHGRTRSLHAGCRNCKRRPTARNVELRSYLQDVVGCRSLVFDLSMTHDRFGSSSHVQQNCLLSHHQDLNASLGVAAQRNINSYRQQYVDNQNISFLPAIAAQAHAYTASFCVFFFYRPTGRPRPT